MPLKDGHAQNRNEKLPNVPCETENKKKEDGMYIPDYTILYLHLLLLLLEKGM